MAACAVDHEDPCIVTSGALTMSGQQDNIAAFSANLREFASNTSDNINGLKRIANSIPCVGRECSTETLCHYLLCRRFCTLAVPAKTLTSRMTGLTFSQFGPCIRQSVYLVVCFGDAASVFREKWKDVVKRVDNVQGQVAAMEKACGKETAVQVRRLE